MPFKNTEFGSISNIKFPKGEFILEKQQTVNVLGGSQYGAWSWGTSQSLHESHHLCDFLMGCMLFGGKVN